jgi:hypothetical protein
MEAYLKLSQWILPYNKYILIKKIKKKEVVGIRQKSSCIQFQLSGDGKCPQNNCFTAFFLMFPKQYNITTTIII